ncbi:MAG: hemerythrin domain-containing protein, partial [Rhodospirillaceae bacterium]
MSAMTTLAAAHTGIELIDRDHGIYRSLADRLQAGRGLGDGEIGRRKAELLSFLDGHIEFENRVMREIDYPISFTHVEEHAAFRSRVAAALDEAGQAGEGQAAARQNIAKVLKKIHDD